MFILNELQTGDGARLRKKATRASVPAAARRFHVHRELRRGSAEHSRLTPGTQGRQIRLQFPKKLVRDHPSAGTPQAVEKPNGVRGWWRALIDQFSWAVERAGVGLPLSRPGELIDRGSRFTSAAIRLSCDRTDSHTGTRHPWLHTLAPYVSLGGMGLHPSLRAGKPVIQTE